MTLILESSLRSTRQSKLSSHYAMRFWLFSLLVICLTAPLHSQAVATLFERITSEQQNLPPLANHDDFATLNDASISEQENTEQTDRDRTDRLDFLFYFSTAAIAVLPQHEHSENTLDTHYQRIALYSYFVRGPPSTLV